MKKIFAVLTIMLLPLITFGDLLPEPDILVIDDNEIITLENDENIGNESSLEQESIGNNTLTEMDDINDENQKQQADLVDVYFGFCNDGVNHLTDTLNAAMIQGDPFPMCLLLYNSDPNNTAYIDINLVYGTLAGDGSPACDVKGMNEFVSSGSMGLVEIPADNYVIKEVEITFPLGYDGEQKACITVSSVDQSPQEEVGGLVILERRAYHASFFVGAIDGIKNEIKVNELATNVDDNGDLILSFFVENIGNMENTFDIQGAVKGFFGYNKAFEVTDGQLAPSKSQFVELNLGSLPSYGGKYNIDFTINGTPYFSYDISNANVDPARLEPKSWEFSTSVFKMPWLILAVVVIFILLLIVLFKKPKQKVVYVQQVQQPQQPVQTQQSQQPTQQYTQPVQPSQPVQQPVQQPTQPIQQPQQPQNPNYPQN